MPRLENGDPMSFKLIYGERMGDLAAGEDYIIEKGVFLSIEEFAYYRAKTANDHQWSGTDETNAMADALIAAEVAP
jgi:hypothetical protein